VTCHLLSTTTTLSMPDEVDENSTKFYKSIADIAIKEHFQNWYPRLLEEGSEMQKHVRDPTKRNCRTLDNRHK